MLLLLHKTTVSTYLAWALAGPQQFHWWKEAVHSCLMLLDLWLLSGSDFDSIYFLVKWSQVLRPVGGTRGGEQSKGRRKDGRLSYQLSLETSVRPACLCLSLFWLNSTRKLRSNWIPVPLKRRCTCTGWKSNSRVSLGMVQLYKVNNDELQDSWSLMDTDSIDTCHVSCPDEVYDA